VQLFWARPLKDLGLVGDQLNSTLHPCLCRHDEQGVRKKYRTKLAQFLQGLSKYLGAIFTKDYNLLPFLRAYSAELSST